LEHGPGCDDTRCWTRNPLIGVRIVAGIAIGIASFVAPLYISEIAPVDIRGKLVSVNQVALTGGIVISYLVDYAFAGSQAWRWMFAMAVIPAAAFGIGLIFIPNSSRWLAARGHMDQARAVLKRSEHRRKWRAS
jgi:MFS transporter, SP family, galactose:H+ symporter